MKLQQWLLKALRENKAFLLFIVLMVVFRSAVADWNDVPTGSMKPTIIEGDRIYVDKLAYDIRLPLTHISLKKLADPVPGDIIIFDSKASDKRLVKRVIGVPGDTVSLRDNRLTINGKPLNYKTVQRNNNTIVKLEQMNDIEYTIQVSEFGSALANFPTVTVPPGHYLAMGDNRDNSADSRVIGFVPRKEIVGRSNKVVLSLDYDNYFLPRSDRYFYSL